MDILNISDNIQKYNFHKWMGTLVMLKILFDIASSSCNTLDMEGQAERLALWDTAYNAWSKTLDLQSTLHWYYLWTGERAP